ncbi:MAG: MBL fold metallo-hydrolase [Chloroflexi bacterium]|nr:MBL fold metallo-hydrolase [Chloroflexota bacterium]
MSPIADFGVTHDVAVTVLVDNRADLLVKSTKAVRYFTDAPLLAEHGFAALIHLKGAGIRILWDAGISCVALLENMKRMKLDPASVDKIVLSHGHGDHTGAMTEILRAMGLGAKPKKWRKDATVDEIRRWAAGRRVPIIAHPAAFRERWAMCKDGARHGPILPPPRAEWEALGGEIVLTEDPYQLGPGCWSTGQTPRRSFEKISMAASRRYRSGDAFLPDEIEDDQAIVINVQDKGLVIVSGCAHSGIVNTVNHGREISGVDRIWGVLGGFHLAPATEEEISKTIAEIKAHAPRLVAPTHCTGFHATSRFAAEMPEAFVQGVVGATYSF